MYIYIFSFISHSLHCISIKLYVGIKREKDKEENLDIQHQTNMKVQVRIFNFSKY